MPLSTVALRRTAVTLAAAGLALVAAVAVAPAPASAAVPGTATLTASATGPVAGTDAKASVTYTVTVADGPIGAPTLETTLPVPVTAADVTVDRKPVDPTTVVLTPGATAPATDLLLRFAGGTLTVGPHTVTIALDLTPLKGAAPPPQSARLGYEDDPPATVTSAPVTIPLPDLVVTEPPGSGEDEVLPLTPGSEAGYAVRVARRGPVVDAATLVVQVPAGLRLDTTIGVVRLTDLDDDGTPLRCTGGPTGTVTCELGKVDQPFYVGVPVIATGTAPAGSTATLSVTATAANGFDATPADNTQQGTVRFVAPSKLTVTLRPQRTRVPVGDRVRIGVTVRNVGAGEAATVIGVVTVADRVGDAARKHFRYVSFDGAPLTDVGTGGDPVLVTGVRGAAPAVAQGLARRAAAVRAARREPQITVLPWGVGTLAPGASRTATLTLQAVAPGKGQVAVAAADPDTLFDCLAAALEADDEDALAGCLGTATLTLTAVRVGAAPAGDGADPIADTGFPTGQWSTAALLALLLGVGLQVAGTRRRTGRHRA